MSIKLPDFLVPAGGSTEFLLEDKYVRGGLHIVPTKDDLETMDPTTLKQGMLCVAQDTNKIYQLTAIEAADDGTNTPKWLEFKVGGGGVGVRQSVTHFVPLLSPNQTAIFKLPLGRCILVYGLKVDTSCKVEAFGTEALTEPNPYTFVATPDHLEDDGSTLMSDGTVLRGRRFSFLANMENSGNELSDINIYFRVTNTTTVEKGVNLTISFLPIESI